MPYHWVIRRPRMEGSKNLAFFFFVAQAISIGQLKYARTLRDRANEVSFLTVRPSKADGTVILRVQWANESLSCRADINVISMIQRCIKSNCALTDRASKATRRLVSLYVRRHRRQSNPQYGLHCSAGR
jgi:hypothetical protein